MKYRRLDSNNDYVFGQNEQDFVNEAEAVRQAVYTRLKLLRGEWWENIEDGFPFFQQIAGKSGTPGNLNANDLLIRARIIGTLNVLSITEYNSTFNNTTRVFTVSAVVNTTFGDFSMEVNF